MNILREKPILTKVIVAVVAGIVLVGAGALIYRSMGVGEFNQGMQAYQAADCESALGHFQSVTSTYKYSSSANVATATAT